jgi:hypothetical protein
MDKFRELTDQYNEGKARGSSFNLDFYVSWLRSAAGRLDWQDQVISSAYRDWGVSRDEAKDRLINELRKNQNDA